jgi:hypothetical protein
MMKALIPCYPRFVQEQKSGNGDDSIAATTFLYQVLPYFVETVLATGIYFVVEYPDHPFSHILQVTPPLHNFWIFFQAV